MTDVFAVWSPFDIVKSRDVNGGDGEPMTGKIGGIVSSETLDQQNEFLAQDGIDWTYFLNKGWFNYEHAAGPENVLGHPESVTPVTYRGKPAHKVEGVLYLHKARAREIYETAEAMKKAGGRRKLGFSVEGQVVERDQNDRRRITKAKVLNVAITAHPVHPDARLEVLARSLTASGIGYQTPAQPAAGFSLSPLVPQHLEAVPAIASFGADMLQRRRLSVEDLARLITTTFPALDYGKAINVATEIIRSTKY